MFGMSRPAELPYVGYDQLRRVCEEKYGVLVGLAAVILGDAQEAEDVVQEAFVRTIARWRSVDQRADPQWYIRSVVVNLCRTRLRRRPLPRFRREREHPSPEGEVVQNERRSAVLSALKALPVRQRECVGLCYFADASVDQVAATLGISAGSVKTHLHRARAALGLSLEEHRYDDQ